MPVTPFFAVAAATALLILIPGPSVVFIVGQALSRRRRNAIASAAGNATGALAAGLVVALGLGPLLQQSAIVVEVMRYAGAVVLVALGVAALLATRSAPRAAAAPKVRDQPTAVSFGSAAVVGVTNPKVYVIFAAVIPPFVDVSAPLNAAAQMMLLTLVPVGIGLVSDVAWALAATRARRAIVAVPSRLTTVKRMGGACLIGVGAYTALQRG